MSSRAASGLLRRGLRPLPVLASILTSLLIVGLFSTPADAASAASTSTLSGVISTTSGAPVDEQVVALFLPYSPTTQYDEALDLATTDSAGRYSFTDVTPGDYRVAIPSDDDAPVYLDQFVGGEPGDYSGDVEAITVGLSPVTVDQKLVSGGRYTGLVTTASGKPVSGARLELRHLEAGGGTARVAVTTSSTSGSYSFTGLRAGSYSLLTSARSTTLAGRTITPRPLEPGDRATIPAIILASGASISGSVTRSTGAKLAKAIVRATLVRADGTIDDAATVTTTTDSRGTYRLVGVPVGSVRVAVLRSTGAIPIEYGGGTTDASIAVTVPVAATGAALRRDLRLAATLTVSGVVRTSAGVRAGGLSGTINPTGRTVDLRLVADSLTRPVTVTTDSRGEYSVAGLAPGSYELAFTGAAGTASSTIFLARSTTGIDVTLTPSPATGATITGRLVTSTGGTQISGTGTLARLDGGQVVTERPLAASYWGDDDWRADSDIFPLTGVGDGDYRLEFAPALYSPGWIIASTVVEFTVSGGMLVKKAGVGASGRSLGTIRLASPQRAAASDDFSLDLAADGLRVGSTVTAQPGTGFGVARSLRYQWLRNERPIAGATGAAYRIQPGDADAMLAYTLAADLPGRTSVTIVTSEPSGRVQGGTVPPDPHSPTISGTGAAGSKLTATAGASGATGYQWLVNDAELAGATTPTLTVTSDLIGESISVRAADDGGAAASAPMVIAAGSAVQPTATPKLLATDKPKKKGAAGIRRTVLHFGATLSLAALPVPSSSLVVSYQWQVKSSSSWKNLTGRTEPTLTIPAKSKSGYRSGNVYRVLVTVERAGHLTAAPSASTALALRKN